MFTSVRHSWTHHPAINCYSGHGATDIDDKSIGVLTLAECEKKCLGLPSCTGITMQVDETRHDGRGNCWRRMNISIGACAITLAFSVVHRCLLVSRACLAVASFSCHRLPLAGRRIVDGS